MRTLVFAACCVLTLPAYSSEEMLLGFWAGGDTYSESTYGVIQISRGRITWGPSSGQCVVAYSIEKEQLGTTFTDQIGRVYVTSPTSIFSTYLLRRIGGNCATNVGRFRFTFPQKTERRYLAMVEYDNTGKPIGWTHFFRRDVKPE